MNAYIFDFDKEELHFTVEGYFDHDIASAWFEVETVRLGINDVTDVLNDNIIAEIEVAAFKALADDAAKEGES